MRRDVGNGNGLGKEGRVRFVDRRCVKIGGIRDPNIKAGVQRQKTELKGSGVEDDGRDDVCEHIGVKIGDIVGRLFNGQGNKNRIHG